MIQVLLYEWNLLKISNKPDKLESYLFSFDGRLLSFEGLARLSVIARRR